METLREILMNSADDDIQTLIDYQKNPERFASLQDKYSRGLMRFYSLMLTDI